jgi:peptidylprolyl isomerase
MIATAIAALVVGFGAPPSGPKIVVTMGNGKSFTIATDQKGSPKTVAHILALVKKKFYDGQQVHRVEDWVTQWGDPQTKTKSVDDEGIGGGGSGENVPFEASSISFKRGVVGLASTAKRIGGDSQLFVLTKDAPYLDGDYAVVGVVTSGMAVLDKVVRGDKIKSMRVLAAKGK